MSSSSKTSDASVLETKTPAEHYNIFLLPGCPYCTSSKMTHPFIDIGSGSCSTCDEFAVFAINLIVRKVDRVKAFYQVTCAALQCNPAH